MENEISRKIFFTELQQPNNVDQHQDSSDNVEVESSLVSPNPSIEPTERDHRQTIIPTKATLIDEEISINHNHENGKTGLVFVFLAYRFLLDLTSVENPYPIDPVELFEARKQIETLRQNLQETNGKTNDDSNLNKKRFVRFLSLQNVCQRSKLLLKKNKNDTDLFRVNIFR